MVYELLKLELFILPRVAVVFNQPMKEVLKGHVTKSHPLAAFLLDQLLTYYVYGTYHAEKQVEISGHYIQGLGVGAITFSRS